MNKENEQSLEEFQRAPTPVLTQGRRNFMARKKHRVLEEMDGLETLVPPKKRYVFKYIEQLKVFQNCDGI